MNYLGIDYGEKRVGLSYGDELGLAVPIDAATEPTLEARLAHIGKELERRRIGEIVIGYPLNMDGSVGFKAKEVDVFIKQLQEKFDLPIHKMDERLTSQVAQSQIDASGKKKPRTIKQRQQQRKTGELDSRAATVILQDYLDSKGVL